VIFGGFSRRIGRMPGREKAGSAAWTLNHLDVNSSSVRDGPANVARRAAPQPLPADSTAA